MTFAIRNMIESEVELAIKWANQEGWNPGLDDARCFFSADPKGFFIGFLDKEPIAVGSAVAYDDKFGFCGLYIVKKEYRQHGYGLELTHKRLDYLGKRIVGLDGVLNKVAKYERLGYVQAHLSQRFKLQTIPKFAGHQNVVTADQVAFEQIQRIDLRYFKAPRDAFVKNWISQKNGHALVYVSYEIVQGFGVIRKCYNGYKIGPLFAETPIIAKALFEGLCSRVEGGPVYLDIPHPNTHAVALVKEYNMVPEFEVIRMYRNGDPGIDLAGVYGVTTFELG